MNVIVAKNLLILKADGNYEVVERGNNFEVTGVAA
jgi:hypothetical protein